MSLEGTYVNSSQGETLVIKQATVSNGEIKGELTSAGVTFGVTGNFHYANSVDDPTSLVIMGGGENLREAWAGNTDRGNDFAVLNLMGARAIQTSQGEQSVCGLGGPFVKQ